LRVLFWNQEYSPSLGGVEVYTERLGQALLSRGHAVSVVTSLSADTLSSYERIDGIEVFRLPFYQVLSSRDLDRLARLRSEIVLLKRRLAPQIVHVNLTDASPILHTMTANGDSATVVAFHRALGGLPSAWGLARGLARRASALVAPSSHTSADAASILELSPDSIHVIENGILSLPDPVIALAELPPPNFLFAGRLVAEKAPGLAIRAIARLHEMGIPALLQIAGTGPDLPALKAMVSQMNLTGHVTFLGILPLARLARAYAEATALLVPSIVPETFGQVAAEASLAGRPVLGSRLGALSETVVDGVTGQLFAAGDVDALATLMAELVTSPGLARRLGDAGQARASSLYTIERMTDRYEALYRQVIEGGRSPSTSR
jgi:glycosyltransferase involved in cell wall biosynthesis